MNTKKLLLTLFFPVALSLLFAGCSSSNNSSDTGSKTTSTSKGVISGFGSVIVNGVEYDSDSATVTIDDDSSNVSSLKVGMEVTIKGSGTTADSIAAADDLEGPVDSVDIATHIIVVLGQTVQTDNLTIFENTAGLTTLSAGDIVEVSGLADGLGIIHATRVELKTAAPAASTPIEVKGIVSNLTATTFTINSLIVSYETATLKDFPAGGIANGQFVEVKSTFGQYDSATTTLIATSVELEPGLDVEEGEHVEVEGYVTDYVSLASFMVNGVPVDASGVSVTGIANGVKVEVEGTVNADGVLVASKVEAEQESDLEIEGDVTSIDAAAGTISILTITVNVTATTEMKDSSPAEIQNFSLADIAAGDHLEIAGYLDSDDKFIATKVERLDPSEQAMLSGPVTAKTLDTSYVILGMTITVDGSTEYKDSSDIAMASADFFAAITLNTTVVKAQWDTFSSLTAPVDELELE